MDDEKKASTMDDTTSTYSKSAVQSMTDKETAVEAEETTRELSKSPTRSTARDEEKPEHLKKVISAAEAQAELSKIMTSGEGVEYPTGLKLNLISLALCLSVFLMALDNTIIATAIPKITDQFHSLDDVGWYGSACVVSG